MLARAHLRFKWRSLDPHYDYGHKSDEKSAEDAKAPNNKKGETNAKLSTDDDSKPQRLELRLICC